MARKGMATRQGGIELLKGKMKELNKSLKEAKKEHKRTNDSVSGKQIRDLRDKISKTKHSITAYNLGKKLSPSERADVFPYFKSGGMIGSNKIIKGYKKGGQV